MSLSVVCLCAEWCGTCRDFRLAYEAVARQWPEARFVWMDIETHEALLDALGIDIENFPTVLIVSPAGAVHFAGPITPFAETLQRLCRAAHAGGLAAGGGGTAWAALLAGLPEAPV
jgi:thiol-disulfide isomerase/thioredoxin